MVFPYGTCKRGNDDDWVPRPARTGQAGLECRELARRAAVSPGTVSKLEGGARVAPSLELGKRLAKALGVTLDYLAGMYDEEEVDASAPQPAGV